MRTQTEPPKELTPKLLGILLGQNVRQIVDIRDVKYKTLIVSTVFFKTNYEDCNVNLHSLTSFMKEFCTKHFTYELFSGYKIRENQWYCFVYAEGNLRGEIAQGFFADSEFEVVLKATDWVMKESGMY